MQGRSFALSVTQGTKVQYDISLDVCVCACVRVCICTGKMYHMWKSLAKSYLCKLYHDPIKTLQWIGLHSSNSELVLYKYCFIWATRTETETLTNKRRKRHNADKVWLKEKTPDSWAVDMSDGQG